MKIVYLLFGTIVAGAIPLGLLKIAVYFSDKQNKRREKNI
jgi:hypothetical protein